MQIFRQKLVITTSAFASLSFVLLISLHVHILIYSMEMMTSDAWNG